MSEPTTVEPARVDAPETSDADRAYVIWWMFTWRLVALSILSIVLAALLLPLNRSVDGFDPFYVALASQFAIWGLIDLIFAVTGLAGLRTVGRMAGEARDAETMRRREKILGALRFNRWLNALWIGVGVALLIWGYLAWSPSLVGHGVGVCVQAIGLVIFDRAFHRALAPTPTV